MSVARSQYTRQTIPKKSIVLLYASNIYVDTKIKNNNTIYNHSKNYLPVNLAKHVQDLHAENYTTL